MYIVFNIKINFIRKREVQIVIYPPIEEKYIVYSIRQKIARKLAIQTKKRV